MEEIGRFCCLSSGGQWILTIERVDFLQYQLEEAKGLNSFVCSKSYQKPSISFMCVVSDIFGRISWGNVDHRRGVSAKMWRRW